MMIHDAGDRRRRTSVPRTERRRYDFILSALTDCSTRLRESARRLESFLFTCEAMEEAREYLAADGMFAM